MVYIEQIACSLSVTLR